MTDETSNESLNNNNIPNQQLIRPIPIKFSNPPSSLPYLSEDQMRDFRQCQSERQRAQIPPPVVEPQGNPFENKNNMILQAVLNTSEIRKLKWQINFCYTQHQKILKILEVNKKRNEEKNKWLLEIFGHLLQVKEASRKRKGAEISTPHNLPKQPAQIPATPIFPFNIPMLNTQTASFPLQTQHNMFTGTLGIPFGWPLGPTTNPVPGEHSGLTPVTSGMENSSEQQLQEGQLAGSIYQALLTVFKQSSSTPPS